MFHKVERHFFEGQFGGSGQAARLFKEFFYQTLKSWSRERRVVAKVEHLEKGENPRFVVTSLSGEARRAETCAVSLSNTTNCLVNCRMKLCAAHTEKLAKRARGMGLQTQFRTDMIKLVPGRRLGHNIPATEHLVRQIKTDLVHSHGLRSNKNSGRGRAFFLDFCFYKTDQNHPRSA